MTPLPISLLGALLLATVSGLTVQAQVAEQDSLALVALYNATDGPNWTDNTNWLMAPVSAWAGVFLTGDRVRLLRLSHNQLTGSIPPELGNLTKLEHLYLQRNNLTGSIPGKLGNLTNLKALWGFDNQLTGSIPPGLGNLTNLRILFLRDNQLTGSIPPELGNLTNVGDIHLNRNQLTGSIPPELANLTNLLGLNLISNQLTGLIPPELGNLPNLIHLHLNLNQLTGPIPPELGNLTNLRGLLLRDNPLSGTLPLSLINLTNLTSFWFDNTNLCEPIDDTFQAWLQGINELFSTGCTNVATEDAAEIPTDFALESNYPNPFNPATRIRYALPQRASVRLAVYDVQGRLINVLVETDQPAGWHEVTFEADMLPSGVYFYRIEAGVFQNARPMLLLR